jgi:alpha-N-arabinofuranosidase
MQDGVLSKVCCTLDGPAASTVGPDEFGRLLDQTGAVGDIIVNFVTGTAQEAADFVAYMTAPPSAHPSHNPEEASYWAALRARNGHRLAYRVPYWEVGNEQYSAGQLGWRSGRVISVGRHRTYCPAASAPACTRSAGRRRSSTNGWGFSPTTGQRARALQVPPTNGFLSTSRP